MTEDPAGPPLMAGEPAAGEPAAGHRAALLARVDEIGAGSAPGRALAARLLRSYVAKTPAGLDRLAELWHGGDADGVRDQAHALKGSATNIGVVAMGELCGGIEDAARAGRLPDPVDGLARVAATFAEVAPICTRLADELD